MRKSDLIACKGRLKEFFQRYEEPFRRSSWVSYGLKYVSGLLNGIERKSIEPIALETDVPVRTLNYFISRAKWDEEALLSQHHRDVSQTLGDAQAILVLDSTGFPKKGKHSIGVKRQWCGQLGKQDNCQVAVTLTYASRHGHTLLNRRLYLPEEWAKDSKRRAACGVPQDVVFRRKWELAFELIELAQRHDLPHDWVTGDEEFGQSSQMQDLLDQIGEKYIFEVPNFLHAWNQPPKVRKPASRGRPPRHTLLSKSAARSRSLKQIAEDLASREWKVYEIRAASKGPLRLRVAWLPVFVVRDKCHVGPAQWLVITQTLDAAPKTKYFLSNAPTQESIESMLAAAYSRFTIEQCHEQAKQEVGLGDYETRSWTGWHHHTALTLLAHHFLVSERKRLGEKIA